MRLNRKRLVVVLEDQIYLYDISNMKMLYTIETSPNPHGKPLRPTLATVRLADRSQESSHYRLRRSATT